MEADRVVGLVLAAGEGRRLGTPKALVQVGGERLVDRAARTLRDGGCAPVYVVSGAVPLEVSGAHVVPNRDWATGMASSLRTGLAAMPENARAVVVGLVDQPRITPEAVARLVAAWRAGTVVAVAGYGGRRRNPVLFDRAVWAEVARLATGDVGARPFLEARMDLVRMVECGDVADPMDVDSPADLDAARR